MGYTYILSTNVGKVRLLIPDNRIDAAVFDDEEIEAFLALETDVRRSAALALETIAADQALTLKVVRLLDLQTDGAKTADALMKRASLLRRQAEDAEAAEDGGAFEVIEMVPNMFGYRQRIANEALREL